MDIKLEKKPWYIRYRYYLAGGVAFLAFLIYVVTLSLGPSKLRIEQDNIQIAEVKNGKFMEYVDVEGVIQPILTIKVNAREAGSVECIIGEEGACSGKEIPSSSWKTPTCCAVSKTSATTGKSSLSPTAKKKLKWSRKA